MRYAIETYELTKKFRHQRGLVDVFRSSKGGAETTAVDNITIKVEDREIFGLLGPNGAGKTTFIKLLCTLVLPSSGTAKIYGYDVVKEEDRVKRLIGFVTSEERSFFWRLTGRENLRFFASLYKLPKKETEKRIEELFELFDLKEVSDRRFNECSTGLKQRLAIARGLLSKPRILFLDEPTRGLDPISANTLQDIIKERIVGHLGNSVFVTTHILSEIEQLCSSIAVMNHGRIIANGRMEEIKSSFQKYEKYHIEVKNFSEADFQRITQMEGIVGCSMPFHNNGSVNIEVRLRKNTRDISDILKFILQNNGRIVKCTMEETTFEDIFHSLFQDQKGNLNL